MAANGTTHEQLMDFCAEIGYSVRFLRSDSRLATTAPPAEAKFLDAVLVPENPSWHQQRALARAAGASTERAD